MAPQLHAHSSSCACVLPACLSGAACACCGARIAAARPRVFMHSNEQCKLLANIAIAMAWLSWESVQRRSACAQHGRVEHASGCQRTTEATPQRKASGSGTSCAAQLLASGVRVSIAYPPDTNTPGYSAEQQTKARPGSRVLTPPHAPREPLHGSCPRRQPVQQARHRPVRIRVTGAQSWLPTSQRSHVVHGL